jgi:hypothetical protein
LHFFLIPIGSSHFLKTDYLAHRVPLLLEDNARPSDQNSISIHQKPYFGISSGFGGRALDLFLSDAAPNFEKFSLAIRKLIPFAPPV